MLGMFRVLLVGTIDGCAVNKPVGATLARHRQGFRWARRLIDCTRATKAYFANAVRKRKMRILVRHSVVSGRILPPPFISCPFCFDGGVVMVHANAAAEGKKNGSSREQVPRGSELRLFFLKEESTSSCWNLPRTK